MHIHPTDTPAVQSMGVQKLESILVPCFCHGGQRFQIGDEASAVWQVTHTDLPDDQRVHQHAVVGQQVCEYRVGFPQMPYPDRGVCKYQSSSCVWSVQYRRRGGTSKSGWLPPSAAKRRPASRAIRERSASRTRADTSPMPVYSRARSNNSSSMVTVVRICISLRINDTLDGAEKQSSRQRLSRPAAAEPLQQDLGGRGGFGGRLQRHEQPTLRALAARGQAKAGDDEPVRRVVGGEP